MKTVIVGIASIGRGGLIRTLESLCAMDPVSGVHIEIVVADDSNNSAVAALLAGHAPWRLPVRIIAVAAGNISAARNACLDSAQSELMAFVDDDEWVARDWLQKLLAAMQEFDADVVVGPVFPVYPADTPAWLVAANPLHVDWGPRGQRPDTGRSGNVLFRRDVIERNRLRFDLALGKSGGEDTDFFHRAHRAGARIVVTDDAIIHEEVAPQRLTSRYLRLRAVRSGQSYARFRLGGRRGADLAGLRFHADAAMKAAAGFGLAAACRPWSRAKALAYTQKGWLNVGKLRQFTGRDLPSMY